MEQGTGGTLEIDQCHCDFTEGVECDGNHHNFMPDHPTPIEARTHVIAAVPYVIYGKGIDKKSGLPYTEEAAEKSGSFIPQAYSIMSRFISE